MSQMQRRGLPHALSNTVKILGACAMLLSATGCTELARFIGKAEPKPEEPVVAEEPATPPATPPADDRVEGVVEKPKPSKLYEWNGDGRKVSRIVIDTDKQRASFFVGDDEIGWSTVASGLPKHPTPTGQFAVMEKVENKRSNLYGKVVKNGKVVRSNAKAGRDPIPAGARFEGAHMPYFMRLTGDGIGLHAGPIPRPGQPASHGCIRLPSTLAPVLFKHVSHGTPVTIVGSGPSYGNYIQKQRVVAAERTKREAEQRRIIQAKAAETAATPAPEARRAAVPPATSARVAAVAEPSPAAAPTPTAPAAQDRTTSEPIASAAREPAPTAETPATGAAPASVVQAAPQSAPPPATATATPAPLAAPQPTSPPPLAETPAATAPAETVSTPAAPPQPGPIAPPESAPLAPTPIAPAVQATPAAAPANAAPAAPAQPPRAVADSPAPAAAPKAPAAEPPPPPAASTPESAPAPAPAAAPAQAQQAPEGNAQGSDG